MATITVRKLDPETVEALKARARQNHRSMEEEVRSILQREAGVRKLRGQEAVDHFRRLQERLFGDRVLSDSVEILREIREADPANWKGE
jgi:plasmid stability protein